MIACSYQYFARPFIYTTALPPQDYKTINHLLNSSLIATKQESLLKNITYFRKELTDVSRYPSDLRSPIQIIETNTIKSTIELAERLKKNGIFTKPISLMIRLFANITAGHIIILALMSLIFIFKSIAVAPVSVAFSLFITVIEIVVTAIQAYIFTILSALYFGMATEEEHH